MSVSRCSRVFTPASIYRASRPAPRNLRNLPRKARGYATAEAPSNRSNSYRKEIIGGLAGGSLVFVIAYGYYHFSGAKTAVQYVGETRNYFNAAKEKLQDKAPEPSAAIDWLRQVTYAYVGVFPGGKAMADRTFNELDKLKGQHSEELTKIVNNAWNELSSLSKSGKMDLSTAQEAGSIVYKYLQQIQDLASKVAGNILSDHPDLQKKYGDALNKLKDLSTSGSDDAKQLANEAMQKVQQTLSQGKFDADSIGKTINSALESAQKKASEGWTDLTSKLKPLLEKNPDLKDLIDKNTKSLQSSDLSSLSAAATKSLKSGDPSALKEAIQSQLQKIEGVSDDAWRGLKARAGIYLEKYPEITKLIEEKGDVLKKIDWEEFMDRIREVKKSGDTGPVKEYIEKLAGKK